VRRLRPPRCTAAATPMAVSARKNGLRINKQPDDCLKEALS